MVNTEFNDAWKWKLLVLSKRRETFYHVTQRHIPEKQKLFHSEKLKTRKNKFGITEVEKGREDIKHRIQDVRYTELQCNTLKKLLLFVKSKFWNAVEIGRRVKNNLSPFLQANVEIVLALDKNFKIFCLRLSLKFIVSFIPRSLFSQ